MIKVDRTNAPCPQILGPDSDRKTKETCAAKEHFASPPPKAGTFNFTTYKHQTVKNSLSGLFHGKCAYCESNYEANHPVDIEHYRPKAEIVLSKGKKIVGYWWLAADWNNLLPSCIDCNRERSQYFLFGRKTGLAGKGSQFPILDPSTRASKPNEELNETPLLLNPCYHDPSKYISFDERDGRNIAVNVGSEVLTRKIARTSISVFGLNRKGLVDRRTSHITRLKLELDTLITLISTLDELRSGATKTRVVEQITEILQHLSKLEESSSEFSAASRALIRPVMAPLQEKIKEHKMRSTSA